MASDSHGGASDNHGGAMVVAEATESGNQSLWPILHIHNWRAIGVVVRV